MPHPMHLGHDHCLGWTRHRMVDGGHLVNGRGRGKWWSRPVAMVAHVEPMLWKESDVFITPLNVSGLYASNGCSIF